MVLMKSVSRFARNTVDALTTIGTPYRWNVDIYFEAEDIHSLHETSEFLLTVICAQVQEERIIQIGRLTVIMNLQILL